MKLALTPLLAALTCQAVSAFPNLEPSALRPRASNPSILIDPPGFPPLPSAQQAAFQSAVVGLNLSNIQGDILIGMRKKKELFFFFSIDNPTAFKSRLGSDILPLITRTTQILPNATHPPATAVNIAFSQRGLNVLGIRDDLNDTNFKNGQMYNVTATLGDQTSYWEPAFAGHHIHGVFLVASDTIDKVKATLSRIQKISKGSISEVYRIQGHARPGNEQGHEHFGFLDGVSNPAVSGFAVAVPGQATVDPGIILLGESGDTGTRPDWAKDGSFLAFRQLQQRVPEFNKFLVDNALSEPGLNASENAELLGARMVGRWKSGAPIDLTPLKDDPVLAVDHNRNNDFNFTHPDDPNFDFKTNQSYCPFSAHIRKTNPRADIANPFNQHIIRAGIPYGPEVTDAENASNSSSTDPSLERGLAFVSYQSNIGQGFAFLQQVWANNKNEYLYFALRIGEDPIIGVALDGERFASGLDPKNQTRNITFNEDFVVSRGGEYFFSPSISAIQNTLSV
ncbi:hypothetical protein GYMLUDRAFT_166740 [Collybiopsis luxurians FD-317 M1]|uniref:Peroxidase n=1 Tax=Collybiopsis luxurians FD-317 M1 TaxID=944289 RepID=A0A0D0BZ71_9AGAR|nr:hypothetical protein GYMLUDRAFT_166740 [Collybiopsis luxurians FD-317 M1]